VRTELGRRIRAGFVAQGPADEGPYVLISADYSQVELRILAHLSEDEGLLEAFEDGRDIHRDTAARVFGVMPELVDAEMRRQAKAVNFGVIYGISAYGLSRNLGIPPKDAGKFIDAYFEQYPGVRRWIDETIAEAKRTGFVTTMLGRKRYVSNLDSSNNTARQAAERVAMNTPVQGSAADIIKLAMVRLDEALEGTKARMLLQVHDELIVEAPATQAEDVAAKMAETMAGAAELRTPLKVDTGIGKNWAEAH
jgi:DNA polymerase-1